MTTVYIGPYLVVPPTPQLVNKTARVCANNCTAPAVAQPAKFCGNCGGAVSEQKVPQSVVRSLPIYKLAQKWTDFMSRSEYGQNHPKGDVWLPNHRGHGMRIEEGAEDSFIPAPLTSLDGAAMLATTEAYYREFVAALKADFGIDAFWEVGIVVYSY